MEPAMQTALQPYLLVRALTTGPETSNIDWFLHVSSREGASNVNYLQSGTFQKASFRPRRPYPCQTRSMLLILQGRRQMCNLFRPLSCCTWSWRRQWPSHSHRLAVPGCRGTRSRKGHPRLAGWDILVPRGHPLLWSIRSPSGNSQKCFAITKDLS